MDLALILSTLDATLRLSTPLLLACLAGLYSERAGVFDIGLEGKMLMAAFAAGAAAAVFDSVWIGLLAGILVSIATAGLQGAAAITLKGNQLIAGTAINMLAAGLTTFLGIQWFAQGGRTPQLVAGERFTDITLPFADQLQAIPLLGPIYHDLISGHNLLVYVAFLAVPITWFVLYRTRFGLRLRAVGENPKAVDTAGISVTRLRYQAVLITGLLCGLAGAFFSIAQGSGFGNNMTAGKGFIALAALIFAKWKPVPAMLTCLLFGFLDALQIRLQNADIMGVHIPVQAIQALPYVLTVVLLAGFIGKAVGPKAGGVPYTKER
ncbi:MAG TPA: ABC transporter permease [Devosia sp.]|nr:ABC transporter permease [Devosia sp.]